MICLTVKLPYCIDGARRPAQVHCHITLWSCKDPDQPDRGADIQITKVLLEGCDILPIITNLPDQFAALETQTLETYFENPPRPRHNPL